MQPGGDNSPALQPVVPAKRLAGRYLLTRRMGRGAMGTVWEAHDEWLDRWVAIKRVSAPSSLPRSELEQVRTRAFREARAIASVADPHVVTVHDLLEDQDGPAIVMELLDAVPVSEVISSGGALIESQTVCIGLAVTSALMAAHGAGVTHRDVKPGNVLLCRDGRVKLTDFGIARSAAEQALTATGLLLGSPAYIAPEVASGKAATPAADIWGLGALLFACLEGKPPYDAGDPLRTLTSVVQDPVPAAPHAGRLTALLGSLLQKDPRRRMALGHVHRLLTSLNSDPTGGSLVIRVWGSAAIPGHSSRRRPTGRPSGPGPQAPSVLPPPQPSSSGPSRSPASDPFGRRPGSPPPGLPRSPQPGSAQPGSQQPGSARAVPAPAAPRPAAPPIPRRDQTAMAAERPRPADPRDDLPPPPWAATGGAAAQLAPIPTRAVPVVAPRSARTKVTAVVLAVVLGLSGFFGARWFGESLVSPTGAEAPLDGS